MLNPMRDKNNGTYRGGRRDDTCGHGLVQKIAEGKNRLRVELESKSDDKYNVYICRTRYLLHHYYVVSRYTWLRKRVTGLLNY